MAKKTAAAKPLPKGVRKLAQEHKAAVKKAKKAKKLDEKRLTQSEVTWGRLFALRDSHRAHEEAETEHQNNVKELDKQLALSTLAKHDREQKALKRWEANKNAAKCRTVCLKIITEMFDLIDGAENGEFLPLGSKPAETAKPPEVVPLEPDESTAPLPFVDKPAGTSLAIASLTWAFTELAVLAETGQVAPGRREPKALAGILRKDLQPHQATPIGFVQSMKANMQKNVAMFAGFDLPPGLVAWTLDTIADHLNAPPADPVDPGNVELEKVLCLMFQSLDARRKIRELSPLMADTLRERTKIDD
jgi:hypothetical protein